LVNNQKIRDVIDTITSKTVLILGRFTDERKAVLDALREELRKHDYLPILFDFAVPATRDITETVSLLARMARFIIADLIRAASPRSWKLSFLTLPCPFSRCLKVQPDPMRCSRTTGSTTGCFRSTDMRLEPLLATLVEKVIAPAEGKVKALEKRRRMIEAELIRPRRE
jgi:hypothetical protein